MTQRSRRIAAGGRAERSRVPLADLIQALAAFLAERYPQYRDQPFARVLVLRLGSVVAGQPTPAEVDTAGGDDSDGRSYVPESN